MACACACAAEDLSSLPFQKNYVQRRATFSDTTGGNDDGNSKHPIKPGEERTIAQLSGPGIITHIWFTVADSESYSLKRIVLRMFWDDDPLPAVETPLGDFFGLGLGQYFVYQSAPLSVGSQKALNCYFPMPFRKAARITVKNEGQENISAFYYNIDWQQHQKLADLTCSISTPNTGRRSRTTAAQMTGIKQRPEGERCQTKRRP